VKVLKSVSYNAHREYLPTKYIDHYVHKGKLISWYSNDNISLGSILSQTDEI